MDVKSTFLNGELEEEVFIKKPKGFQQSEKEDYVCRLKKPLYVLKEAPTGWYAHLDKHIHQKGFKKCIPNSNLYLQMDNNNLTIIEVYVDNIIFGSNDDQVSKKFSTEIESEFEMYLLGELAYFLGFQIS